MANKRMFSLDIVDSDAFVSMPLSTQALYFHLSMRADDDGFVKNPKRIQRDIGSNEDDMKVLIAKRFILPFESGIVVIKHWKINNNIRSDRYKPTTYIEERSMLVLKENGAYTEAESFGIPSDTQMGVKRLPQYSIGKNSIGLDKCSSSVDDDDTTTPEENILKAIGGKLGKGVVYLTDRQFSDLLEKIGLDAFNRYVERLATFIIDKKAYVKNHYETILKWYEEDTQVK